MEIYTKLQIFVPQMHISIPGDKPVEVLEAAQVAVQEAVGDLLLMIASINENVANISQQLLGFRHIMQLCRIMHNS